jgi:hypothetical protein
MLRLRFGFALCLAAGSPLAAAAQPIDCPADSVQTFGGALADGASATYPLDIRPCETLTINVATTATEPPVYYGASTKLSVYNSSGESLFSNAWSSYPTASQTLPSDILYSAPYRGTRGPSGLPSHLVIQSLARASQHTIVVTRSRRPHYNTGGTSAATATLLSTFPRTIYASIQPSETGQYFRVRLAPGGRIRVSGTAQASSYYGANLWARVYLPNGSLESTLLGAIACYGTCDYTSEWYTNVSSVAREFILRVNAQSWMLWDVVMTVEADEGPRLTLFLDADGSFNVNAPSSDHESYVPGSSLGTGESVPLPQALNLIAAYVNSSGQIVAPPYGTTTVGFTLDEVSSFPGDAMNHGSSTGPDYALAMSSSGFGTDNTARVFLSCSDYGGYAVVAAHDGGASPTLRLPDDVAGSRMPRNGWQVFETTEFPVGSGQQAYVHVAAASDTPPQDDSDATPASNELPGDNLIAFEEYRGFFLEGRHHRLDPTFKDVFLLNHYGRGNGAWDDATSLGLRIHEIDALEMSASRLINFNFAGVAGHVPQQGIIFYESPQDLSPPALGVVPCVLSQPCYPNVIGNFNGGDFENHDVRNNARVSKSKIAALSPGGSATFGLDSHDYPAAQMLVGHEFGHTVGIEHNPDVASIMRSPVYHPNLVGQLPTVHDFTPVDRLQLRLK